MHRSHIDQFLMLGFTDYDKDPPKTFSYSETSSSTAKSSHLDEIKRIKIIADRILGDEKSLVTKQLRIKETLESQRQLILERREKLLQCDILSKYKRYMEIEYKIKLLTIGKHLHRLSATDDIKSVPEIIFDLLDVITPDMRLPSYSIIRLKINQHSAIISKSILHQFHNLFETQLQENTTIEGSKSVSEATAESHLNDFFDQAKDWLLSYAMVCMLPYAVSPESKSQCLIVYENVLDDSLTPLWGRFHFHLATSRETNSPEQILWSFSYAKTFVELLVDICKNISSTGKLHRLYEGSYDHIGIRCVVNKAMRFIRSHVIQLLEKYGDSLDIENDVKLFVMEIVESSLEFDEDIQSITSTDLYLGAVIYDVKPVHALWIDYDFEYFFKKVADCIVSPDDIFSSQFGSTIEKLQNSGNYSNSKDFYTIGDLNKDFQVKYSGYRCYRGIYDCLSLFHVACKRYSRLSPLSQDIFGIAVLEPLLLLPVALLVYRIQTNRSLHRLSVLPKARLSDAPEEEDMMMFGLLSEFIASAQYLESSLSAVSKESRKIALNESRLESRWESIKKWMPPKLLPSSRLTERWYSPAGLVETAFMIPGWEQSESQDTETKFSGKAEIKLRDISGLTIGTILTNKKGVGVISGTLGGIIDQAVSYCKDVCTKLESQFQMR